VQSPGEKLIDKDYLAQRASLISQRTPMKIVSPGVPKGWEKFLPSPETDSPKPPGTTHISIVDARGNMVAMTSSIEDAFGSRLMANGFLLNNQLTDFSFRPVVDGKVVANRPEGGKRPRSSMAPTFVFKPNGQPFLVIGSAGGSAIPGYIAQRIISIIDWQMTPKEAMDMQNIINRGNRIEMEEDGDLARGLRAIGHPVDIKDLNSGLTMIQFDSQIIGIADPRREGTAMGE
jgi:gamma-glutamyltranspeptidase / glutathione hydrolase